MSKTPSKCEERLNIFIPHELKSPNKDQPVLSKLIFTHSSTLHSLINDWIRLRDRGTKICKAISALKIHEFSDHVFPKSLGPLTESLLEALEGMKNAIDGVAIVNKQLKAVSQLQPMNVAIINTWSSQKISDQVDKIYSSLLKEYELKQCITENIAHCRDENLIEIYVSSWELEVYFDIQNVAYLFAETGLTGIT